MLARQLATISHLEDQPGPAECAERLNKKLPYIYIYICIHVYIKKSVAISDLLGQVKQEEGRCAEAH